MILSAQASAEARRVAMDALLQTYWKPLYVFIRRKGLDAQAAQDAVQDLIIQLVERDFVAKLTPERGKLRSFLRAAAANYLANRHEKETAKKREGIAVELDFELAERLASEEQANPDDAFDRQWAARVMERAMARLRSEFQSGERAGPVELVEKFFGGGEPPPYKDAAAKHGMSVPQLKSFLHRARGRFRELLREEVGDTVHRPEEAEAELQHLVQVLSG
jgi:RNA polymerase sigma factor (sigma-70 family)